MCGTGGLASCTNLPEITEMDQMEHSVVYIEEFTSSPQQSFAVDEQEEIRFSLLGYLICCLLKSR